MQNKTDTKQVHVRIPIAIYNELKFIADLEKWNMNTTIVEGLKLYLDSKTTS